jgi:hypothetical protein
VSILAALASCCHSAVEKVLELLGQLQVTDHRW